jgi:hypothetical protein
MALGTGKLMKSSALSEPLMKVVDLMSYTQSVQTAS